MPMSTRRGRPIVTADPPCAKCTPWKNLPHIAKLNDPLYINIAIAITSEPILCYPVNTGFRIYRWLDLPLRVPPFHSPFPAFRATVNFKQSKAPCGHNGKLRQPLAEEKRWKMYLQFPAWPSGGGVEPQYVQVPPMRSQIWIDYPLGFCVCLPKRKTSGIYFTITKFSPELLPSGQNLCFFTSSFPIRFMCFALK